MSELNNNRGTGLMRHGVNKVVVDSALAAYHHAMKKWTIIQTPDGECMVLRLPNFLGDAGNIEYTCWKTSEQAQAHLQRQVISEAASATLTSEEERTKMKSSEEDFTLTPPRPAKRSFPDAT